MATTKYLNAKHGIEIWHDDGITQIIAGNGDPAEVGREASRGSVYLRSDNGGGIYTKIGDGDYDWQLTSVDINATFVSLTDTPNTYTDSDGSLVSVNSTTSGVEFSNVIDCGTFI
jgi:hypothetical protein